MAWKRPKERDTIGAGKIYRRYRKERIMVDTDLTIKLSCAAYRLNEKKHIKSDEAYYAALDAKHLQRNIEESGHNMSSWAQRGVLKNPREEAGFVPGLGKNAERVKVMANRDHMVLAYDDLQEGKEVKITAKDKKLAEDIVSYFKGLLFKQLKGRMTDFNEKILKTINEPMVPIGDFGFIASLPKIYFNAVKWDKEADRERDLADSSDYSGTLHKRCEFDLKLLSTRVLQKHGCSIITCVDAESNVVKFFSTDFAIDSKLGDKFKITAYVKDHSVSKYNGGKETVINRVKLVV